MKNLGISFVTTTLNYNLSIFVLL